VLRDAKIVTPQSVVEGSIAVNDGKISAVGVSTLMPQASRTIDCRGRVVIPGPVDGHVHYGEPNRGDEPSGYVFSMDGFETGSRAAAAGGITTTVVMPDSWPVVTNGELVREKAAVGESKSVVDFALHGAFYPGMDYSTAIPSMVGAGAAGIKTFMVPTGYDSWPMMTDGELYAAFQEFRKADGLALVHAENHQIISYLSERLRKEGRKDPATHLESRPPFSEVLADRNVVFLGKLAGNRFLIVHTGVPEGVEEVHSARVLGYDAYVESCPHYFYLSDEDVRARGPLAKCSPPLRDRARIARLWESLDKGWIDTIGSDHGALSTPEMHAQWDGDMWRVEAGLPGLQTMLPVMVNGVAEGRISMSRLAAVVSENPARVFGLYPKKGALLPGSDADLVVIDMDRDHTITDEEQLSLARWTPFDGFRVRGYPVVTVSRGEVVMEDGEVLGKAARGRFVPSTRKNETTTDNP
jgi:allantoinase